MEDGEGDAGVIDDSREWWKKPFELFTGKEFKLFYWEEALAQMKKGEKAEFMIPKQVGVVLLV